MTDYEKILLTLDRIDVKINEMVETIESLKGSIITNSEQEKEENIDFLKAARQRNKQLLAVVGDK